MSSKNGTFVRSTRITELTVLNNGDEVRIGQFQFVFRVEETPPSTETEVLSRNASAD
jgi:pSer/pThr/pTyr-binding forkhead associated (FHA) protein